VRTNRGFTGHEMLDDFGLVHMNGRIYDSRTARFLQADPFVQEPNNPQNFNRFAYLWNNPLNATDPSGYLGVRERQWLSAVVTIVAIAFQQYYMIGSSPFTVAAYYAENGAIAGGIATQSWNGAMQGALTSAASAGIGAGTAGLKVWQAALVSGVSNGILSSLQGGKFGHGFVSAGLSTYAGQYTPRVDGAVGQVLLDALVGGTISELSGGKFANGAVTAAMRSAVGAAKNSTGMRLHGKGILGGKRPWNTLSCVTEKGVRSVWSDLRKTSEIAQIEGARGQINFSFDQGNDTAFLPASNTININFSTFDVFYGTQVSSEFQRSLSGLSPEAFQSAMDSFPSRANFTVARVLFHEAFHAGQKYFGLEYSVNPRPFEEAAINFENRMMWKYFGDTIFRSNDHSAVYNSR
jgi:RHS repeat-associated protein